MSRATQRRRREAAAVEDWDGLTVEEVVGMLRQMTQIRAFDDRLPGLYTKGLIRGSTHAAIGQEAVAVGACAGLEPGDLVTSTHRGHGHAIAKGAGLRRMMAELFGKASGYCHGRGGSMHIADFSVGMLGANGIVGGGLGIAAGAALTAKLRSSDQVALCFFGDGAINQGSFGGVANMAAIWKLPVIFLCENNRFAMSARVEEMTSVADLAERARGYGFPGDDVDGMDPIAVRAAVREAGERARAGEGPSLVVASCYRFMGHFSGDTMAYRTKEETEEWLARDPVAALRKRLLDAGVLSKEEADAIARAAEDAVSEAVAWAEAEPPPDASEAMEGIYA